MKVDHYPACFALCLAVTACTNDYDQFAFGSGGAGAAGAGAASEGGGGANAAGGTPEGGGGTAAVGGGGSTSTGTPGEVPCGNGAVCDVDAGDSCCIDENGAASGQCKDSCAGNEATLDCNEPADCPGEECCADISGGGDQESECKPSCGDDLLCNPADPDCGGGRACEQHPDLPPGYFYCN